jgi:hypothetical protein
VASVGGLASILSLTGGLLAQCAPVSFILQDRPVAARPHTTPELFAHEVAAVERAVPLGETGSLSLYAAIVSDLEGTAAGGIQHWTLGLGTLPEDGVRITAWSKQGTALDGVPEGLFDQGFNKTVLQNPAWYPCFSSGLTSTVLLSFAQPVTLPPRGTATALGITVEATAPQGLEPQRGTIGWLVGGGPDSPCPFAGPAGGSIPPSVLSIVTIDGSTGTVCDNRSASIAFVAAGQALRRGDVNSDARVDISDAIRAFMYLFLGAAEPSCLDTADTNDSGQVDISDGIVILNDFFLPGQLTAISAPGPFDCGPDPTADGLRCRTYPPCEQGLPD